mmetsp:Transcript_41068/g.132061  ORF Transcript_41068/g.132061 Transcript_41068/m.132061 type:complete len:209 (-) Transcript_41068:517-1143(-)
MHHAPRLVRSAAKVVADLVPVEVIRPMGKPALRRLQLAASGTPSEADLRLCPDRAADTGAGVMPGEADAVDVAADVGGHAGVAVCRAPSIWHLRADTCSSIQHLLRPVGVLARLRRELAAPVRPREAHLVPLGLIDGGGGSRPRRLRRELTVPLRPLGAQFFLVALLGGGDACSRPRRLRGPRWRLACGRCAPLLVRGALVGAGFGGA